MGHAILGDRLYAAPGARGKAPRLLLHASALSFRHPVNGHSKHFFSQAPF
jgi:tRNA pseudouridine32 synthase/23S rRNA pseudouridine746 synthase